MKNFLKPASLWLVVFIIVTMTVVVRAAAPWFYGNVVTSAAVTPSPAQTGYYGMPSIVQATAAPTAQPGYLNVTHLLENGTDVGTGIFTSLSCSVNIVCSPATGPTPNVTITNAPTFTGNLTAAATYVGTTTVGYSYLTSNGSRGIEFDGSNYDLLGGGSLVLPALGGVAAGSSTYGPTFTKTNGYISAGEATGATLTAGDLGASRGVSSGALNLGGSTSSCLIDYGVTTAAVLTHACATTITGILKATTATNAAIFGVSGTASGIEVASNSGGAGSAKLTAIAAGLGTVAGISGDVFGVTDNGNAQQLAIRNDGYMGVRGGIVAGSTIQANQASTATYVPPVYTAAGAAVASTEHVVQDKVTAAGASTTVTLSGAAAFTSSTSYTLYVYDETTLAAAVVTAKAAGSFSFTSVNTQVYTFFAIGT